jgi:hypothetical protein
MSHPDSTGEFIVMVLDVNLIRPLNPPLMKFWGRNKDGMEIMLGYSNS